MHAELAGVRQVLGSGESESTIPVSPVPARPTTITVPDIVPIDPQDVARRREDALRAHLTTARDALGQRDYKRAVEEAMQAAVFGIKDPRVQQLLDQINTLQREQQIAAARASGIRGDFTHALEQVDRALELDPTNPTAPGLRRELERARAERDERKARAAASAAALDRGRRDLNSGHPEVPGSGALREQTRTRIARAPARTSEGVEIDEAGKDTSDGGDRTFRRPSKWRWPARATALAAVAAATGMFVASRFGVDQADPRPPVEVVDAVPPDDVADRVPTDGVADPIRTDVADPVPADDVVDPVPEGDTEQLTDSETDGEPPTGPGRPDVGAALQRAQAVLESRRFDEAASAFQSVLARDPSNQTARDGLAEANAGAAAHLAQVNQLLGRAETAFALGDLTTTRATYEEILTLAPDDERARAGLDAVVTAEALTRGEPTNDIAEWIAAARRAFEGGDLATARDEYGKVLAVDPDNTLARTGLEAVREAEAIINRPE